MRRALSGIPEKRPWLRGLDLNQRPLGYEPNKPMTRLCLSITYVDLVLPFSAHLRGVLFSICSQSCSQSRSQGYWLGITIPHHLCSGAVYSWRLGGCCPTSGSARYRWGGHLLWRRRERHIGPPFSLSVPSAARPGPILTRWRLPYELTRLQNPAVFGGGA